MPIQDLPIDVVGHVCTYNNPGTHFYQLLFVFFISFLVFLSKLVADVSYLLSV